MARKRGMQYIPYDYEAAYNKAMEDMHRFTSRCNYLFFKCCYGKNGSYAEIFWI